MNPVNEFVERQGIPCYVHDLDTDDMMRRVQLRINKGEGDGVLGRGFGFFSVIQEVMKVWPRRTKEHTERSNGLISHCHIGGAV